MRADGQRLFAATIVLALVLALGLAPTAAAAFDPASQRNRAAALLDTGEDERAIAVFRDLVKRLPQSVPDRVNLGIALLHHNDLAGAEQELRQALETDARDLRARYNLGIVLKRRGKNEEAAAALAAVAATPEGKKDASVFYNLGVLYKRLRKGEDALVALREAVALRPEHASAHFQIYNELIQRGEKAEAAKELEQFKALQKATPDFQRMDAYLERGRFTEIAAPGPLPAGALPPGAPREAPRIVFERVGEPSAAGGASRDGAAPVPGAQAPDLALPAAGALGDFDGDGRLDAAFVTSGATLGLFRLAEKSAAGKGSASAPFATLEAPAHAAGGVALAAGDVDNDGDLDLFVSSSGGVRLYLSDGKGAFRDVSKESGLGSGGAGALSALFSDIDRDGDLDLVLGGSGAEGSASRILLNANVDPGAAVAPGAPVVKAGDRSGAAARPPRFLPAGNEAKLPSRAEALAAFDLSGRDDPDLLFAIPGGNVLARNLRAGRFSVAPLIANETAAPASGGVEVETQPGRPDRDPHLDPHLDEDGRDQVQAADLDGDGWTDAISLRSGRIGILWNDDGNLGQGETLARERRGTGSVRAIAPLDADLDGDVDILALDAAGRLGLFRNAGRRSFEWMGQVAPGLAPTSAEILTGDVTGDGAPDVILFDPASSRPVLLKNATKSENRSLRVDLTGTKSNRTAVGAKLQVRADRLQATREYDGRPAVIGIGPRGRVDAVRVVWPTGITQDLVDVPAGSCKIEEKREFAGSCPFLYAWEGDRFRFVGEALSGAPVGFLRPDGSFERPRATEHLRLSKGLPAARIERGRTVLSLRMTEEMRELTALDRVRLVAVDHPAGVEVYSNERLREGPDEPFRFVALEGLRPPTGAALIGLASSEAHGGRTATQGSRSGSARPLLARPGSGAEAQPDALRSASLDRVRSLDGRGADEFPLLGPRLEGLAGPHVLALEFSTADLAGAPEESGDTGASVLEGKSGLTRSHPRLALVLEGWVSWMTSDVSRALLQGRAARTGEEDRSSPRSDSSVIAAPSVDAPMSFAGVALPAAPEPWGPAMEIRAGGAAAFEPDLGLPVGPVMIAPLPDLRGGRGQSNGSDGTASGAPGTSTVWQGGSGSSPESPDVPDASDGSIEVRIGTNLAVYYDRVRLGRISDAPLEVREIEPIAADLRWRGVAASRRHADAEPQGPRYEEVVPEGPFRTPAGTTTPRGGVLSLVSEADGLFAVFGNGEEIALDFDASALPPPRSGFTRTWFLISTGYARDGDPNTEPLPWPVPMVPR